jgi:hypothetical protein
MLSRQLIGIEAVIYIYIVIGIHAVIYLVYKNDHFLDCRFMGSLFPLSVALRSLQLHGLKRHQQWRVTATTFAGFARTPHGGACPASASGKRMRSNPRSSCGKFCISGQAADASWDFRAYARWSADFASGACVYVAANSTCTSGSCLARSYTNGRRFSFNGAEGAPPPLLVRVTLAY